MASRNNDSQAMTRLSRPLPEGTIDSHMHIIPPDFKRFPLQAAAQYKPIPHTLADAQAFYTQTSGLGIPRPRMVLTQVSIYGNDNSALLSGTADLEERGRGVIQCDPAQVTIEQLDAWWQQGARGVRINLVSVGQSITEDELLPLLQAYIDKISQSKMPGGDKRWVIEMFLPLKSMPMLLNVLPKLNGREKVRFCLDHFGGLKFKDDAPSFGPNDDPYLIPGFKELVQLITDRSLPEVYLKISAQYRVDPEYPSQDARRRLDPVGKELVQRAEDRVTWASDWPHTRFENIDSVPFVESCYSWCGEGADGDARKEKLFRLNSERLWDMAQNV
ncbi:hypothetical protein PMZ80_010911 [Knufia obscura]|uniref:Amidohydrolase-related domain-containing protein n=1 Tax=Knufia obscura TaxID=1635080 RepID=A0ABR0R840_9EURO|nr:hypothetical protein PMZ80_010911 [Knufia obscura]